MAASKFNILEHKLASKKGVRNPRALTAYIGRRKYGASEMAKAAAEGRSARLSGKVKLSAMDAKRKRG